MTELENVVENNGSVGKKKSFIISNSGKFKSKTKKRMSIMDEIWIGPMEELKNKVSLIRSALQLFDSKSF